MNYLEQSGHDFTEEKQEAFNWDIDNKMPINNTRFNPPSKEDIYNKPRPIYSLVDSPVNSPADKPGEPTQLPLTEPLFKCRIGWAYDNKRELNKRTGLPLKKKPSYRYVRTNFPLHLGEFKYGLSNTIVDALLLSPEHRTCVVFIPNELWDRYPNSESYYKPATTISGESARLVMSAGAEDYTNYPEPIMPLIDDFPPSPRGYTHIDKPGFFRKIWNWINS